MPAAVTVTRISISSPRWARGHIVQEGAQRQAGGGAQHRLFRIGQAGDDGAAAFGLFAQQPDVFHSVEFSGSERSSSRATTAMVPSGVPSSCAAAVASAPSAARRCSRDKASWVAARPADMRADSEAMRQA